MPTLQKTQHPKLIPPSAFAINRQLAPTDLLADFRPHHYPIFLVLKQRGPFYNPVSIHFGNSNDGIFIGCFGRNAFRTWVEIFRVVVVNKVQFIRNYTHPVGRIHPKIIDRRLPFRNPRRPSNFTIGLNINHNYIVVIEIIIGLTVVIIAVITVVVVASVIAVPLRRSEARQS